MTKLDELRIYNLANEIGDIIWKEVTNWNYLEKDTIGKQLIRSSDSMAANIAEGYGRFHFKESKQFLYYARGSAYESICWITKAARRNLIKNETQIHLSSQLETFLKGLNAYIKTIGNKPINN